MRSARIEALAAAAVIAAAAGLLLSAMQFPTDSRIFPMMVLGALLIAGILWLMRSLLAPGGANDGSGAAVSNRRQLFGAAAVTAAYGVAVSLSSYFIPTVIYIPLMAFVLGNRNLPVTVASSAGFTVMIYLIFVWLFERPIPLI